MGREMSFSCGIKAAPASVGNSFRAKSNVCEAEFSAEFRALAKEVKAAQRGNNAIDMEPDTAPETVETMGDFEPAQVMLSPHVLTYQAFNTGLQIRQSLATDKALELEAGPEKKPQGIELDRAAFVGTSGRKETAKPISDSRIDVQRLQKRGEEPTGFIAQNFVQLVNAQSIIDVQKNQFLVEQTSHSVFKDTVANGGLPTLKNMHVETIKRNDMGSITHIDLVLEPAELGRISVRLEHENDRLVLILTAENKSAAIELAQDSGLLLRALGNHIAGLETMSVVVRQDGEGNRTSSQTNMNFGGGEQRAHQQNSEANFGASGHLSRNSIASENTTSDKISI